MKQFFILTAFFFAAQFSAAQKTEFHCNAYSGIFFFRGDGTAKNATVVTSPFYSPSVTLSNSYGKQTCFSYAVELQVQQITKANGIYGLSIGFETLASKLHIDSVYMEPEVIILQNQYMYPASGKAILHNTFITLHPFAGKRFMYRKIFFDVTAGFDAGFCLRTKESGTAQYTVNNNEHTLAFSNQLAKPWVDIRPTMSIRTGFKKWSCIAGYSLGLTNFKIGTRGKAFSDFLRLGLSYQIK